MAKRKENFYHWAKISADIFDDVRVKKLLATNKLAFISWLKIILQEIKYADPNYENQDGITITLDDGIDSIEDDIQYRLDLSHDDATTIINELIEVGLLKIEGNRCCKINFSKGVGVGRAKKNSRKDQTESDPIEYTLPANYDFEKKDSESGAVVA